MNNVAIPYNATPRNKTERDLKVKILYEEYIKLSPCLEVWLNPVTEKPKLEPMFTAGWQGIELAFVLMSEFVSDSRVYVVKRPRVELIAADIMTQMNLMAEIIDGELEDESVSSNEEAGTLQQNFPFKGSPPTTSPNEDEARQSPALDMMLKSVSQSYDNFSEPEKNSIRKVVRNITGTFLTCFSEWSVGVGIEGQLSSIRQLVGLPPLTSEYGKRYLDYKTMVRPSVITDTLTNNTYDHREDFFFRSVHLGTECWAFVALRRLQSAGEQLTKYNHWHNAAAHITSASHILSYLGDHIMMLTSMVLRDYLQLKVEIEGTSGEGSSAVKMLRPTITALLEPFMATLSDHWGALLDASERTGAEYEQRLLMHLYRNPEKQPGLYAYAKALESIESGLLGGFYYKHYCLASNVIGTGARGTMNKAVKMLKISYENPVFPNLDAVRSELGAKIDKELIHNKGKIMDEIEQEYMAKEKVKKNSEVDGESFFDASDPADAGGCPFGFGKSSSGNAAPALPEASKIRTFSGDSIIPVLPAESTCAFDDIRRSLYSTSSVPPVFMQAYMAEVGTEASKVAFLDHAWGKTPPSAHVAATKRQYALYQKGNAAWDTIFGDIMPEAIEHIRWILSPPEDSSVEFGHNSHELISRLISIKMEKLLVDGAAMDGDNDSVLRILTTDTEFYSFTRQMNRLLQVNSSRISIEYVPIEPLATFPARFADKVADSPPLDMIYVSHCVFSTQQTIVPDLTAFTTKISNTLKQNDNSDCFFVVDGYHGFGAIPTNLSCFKDVFYVSGMLKHVGSGANCCFLIVPQSKIDKLKPVFTGWIADPSVLAAESKGIQMGSDVGYVPGFTLQGGTPAFAPSLMIFNEVMRRWKEKKITVDHAHEHVMALHRQFLAGIKELVDGSAGGASCCWSSIADLVEEESRSHTITFLVKSPTTAKNMVLFMGSFGVDIDSRKHYVRVGFGFNHHPEDVKRLLVACAKVASMVDSVKGEAE
jgi:selenocysteine lyase/cysteine desulfurase/tryptophan 2,3-dioxygenase